MALRTPKMGYDFATDPSDRMLPHPCRVLIHPAGNSMPSRYTPSIPNSSMALAMASATKSCHALLRQTTHAD